ncbi:uncharacterized protein B0P05DRAFT_520512 [Gilbertella persicaria]|uniref:uncharacterized protein n=1 Tax=Gilbertella persicaria TaxID=101096 RepID=UPI00221F3E1A|nr:uncharacterized protein B0P05DRAFT_520512 [Gilbertella persicaria]KAI8098125.1 hypothetical protein B0P05DRAFT_520512 [Gilbertella persicaria]
MLYPVLNDDQIYQLLHRLNSWRHGICPNGKLSDQNCFVLNQKPCITIHPEPNSPITTELITEWDWADNLVNCGALTHLSDDSMMNTFSDFYLMFHAAKDTHNNVNTLHLLQLRKHASFKVDQISRPTRALQTHLDQLKKTQDPQDQWHNLMTLWHTFGYLWPRKLILGYKTHLKQTYKFTNQTDSMNGFYFNLNLLKEEWHALNPQTEFDLQHFMDTAEIVSRMDLVPMHAFLMPEWTELIQGIMTQRHIRVSIYQPIKFYNIATQSYLCWDVRKHQDFLVRAIASAEIDQSPETQYLWRCLWTPNMNLSHETDCQHLSGFDQIYIYPACRSNRPDRQETSSTEPWQIQDRTHTWVDTHTMPLSCRPYSKQLEPHRDFSKLRGLQLVSSPESEQRLDWTIEYPNNQLKYMTEIQVNLKLNFHEHIRRRKPLMYGDTIQLQQIGLLTAFLPVMKPNVKSSNKRSVLCVDEDITAERWTENTYWTIELADKADMKRHALNYCPWPPNHGPLFSRQGKLLAFR